MSAIISNMISQLTVSEKEKIINYIQFVLSEREENSLLEGYQNYLAIREDAKNNGTLGMTIDEIEDEIKLTHKERNR